MAGADDVLPPPLPTGPWEHAWFGAAAQASMEAWRCVESQTAIATLKLVESMEEHEALEAMLEDSKPPLAAGSGGLHYLLATPFRYCSPTATRFRAPPDPGIWYGGDSVETVLAECAHWRLRFIRDAVDLCRGADPVITAHTVYAADVQGGAIDLTAPPWLARRADWTSPTHYGATQALGREARRRGIEWIRYESVRRPGATCAAVLSVAALAATKPRGSHDWVCKASRDKVLYYSRERDQRLGWDA